MLPYLSPFSLRIPQQIRFGRGAAAAALPEIASLGKRAFVVHGRTSLRAQRLLDGLVQECTLATGHATTGEPDLAQLDSAIDAARSFAPDLVIACGGGSALDLAKAVAALVPNPGVALDYLEVIGAGRSLSVDPLPFVAIPTTAGTGAEATKNAVIGSPEHARKVSLRDDRMVARLAIVDPALTDGTPLPVTLSCGLDAITQVIEPYLSSRANPVTDALCLAAIPAGLRALDRLKEREDPDARDTMAYVSLMGGIALANAGLGAVHGLAGPLGGVTSAAHGAICGALLPHAIARNAQAMSQRGLASARIDAVRGIVRSETGRDLHAFVKECHAAGLPRLRDMGIAPAQFPSVADAALASSSMKANPVALDASEVETILLEAYAMT